MNKQKVNDFVDAFCDALSLKQGYRTTLKELMENIITKYEKSVYTIPSDSNVYLIKPTNGAYSVEDFFLNRLMRNVWAVSVVDDIDEKGAFTPAYNDIVFNIKKINSQMDKYQDILGNDFMKKRESARKKVVMHEFQHALQTVYTDELDMQRRVGYKKISDELKKYPQYASILRRYEELPRGLGDSSKYISTGTHYSSNTNLPSFITYRNNVGMDNFNEILNESESLDMSGHNAELFGKTSNKTCFFNMYNPESSNCSITNYGFMIRDLLGPFESFKLMYYKPEVVFKSFNEEYGDIFEDIYGTSDAIGTIMEEITKIKKTGNYETRGKLDKAFALCLSKKVDKFFHDSKVPNSSMLTKIERFEKHSMFSNKKQENEQLEHVQILSKLKNRVNSRAVKSNNRA